MLNKKMLIVAFVTILVSVFAFNAANSFAGRNLKNSTGKWEPPPMPTVGWPSA